MLKKLGNTKIIFLLILSVSTAVRVLLSLFPKTACVYNDELFYLELAQNIWNRGSFTVYTTPLHFTKLLYPLLLSPFYAVKDGALRVQLISAFNALLLSSSLIPGYLLAKRTLKKTSHITFVILFLALSPNLLFSVTFMAENLYYPLLLWGFYAAYRFFTSDSQKPLHAFFLGVLAFLIYFAKEVGAAYAAAVAAALLAGRMGNKKGRKEVYLPLGLYLLGILVPYLLLRFTLLSGMGYSYSAQVSFSNLSGAPQLLYLLYAAGMMLLFFLVSTLYLPVMLPLLSFKKLSPAKQRLLVLAAAYTVLVAGGVAFGVSLFSDFPQINLRVHLRYFLGAAFPFLLLALPLAEKAEPVGKRSRLLWHTAVFAGLCVIFLILPKYASLIDAPALQAVRRLGSSTLRLWVWKLAPAALLGLILLLWNKKRRQAFAGLLGLLLVFEVCSGICFYRDAKKDETTDPALLAEVKILDNYLDTVEGTALVLTDSPFDPALRLLNTVSDNDYAAATNTSVRSTALQDGVPDPRRLSWKEEPLLNPVGEFAEKTTYNLSEVTRVITIGKNKLLDQEQYEDVTPQGVTSFTVLLPKDTTVLSIRDLLSYIPGEEILFWGGNPDYVLYRPNGFSSPEAEWCWTEGKEASLTLRPQTKSGQPEDLDASWSWKMTHGDQPCQVYANDTLILDDIATTEDAYCFFTIPKEAWPDGTLTLRLLFPPASSPGANDTRELAVAFDSLTLTEKETE